MTWIDRILDLLHLAWFEVTQAFDWVWARVRAPLGSYVAVVVVLVLATIVPIMVVIVGVGVGSTFTIFWGGILLLAMIVLVGAVLIPAALGTNIIRALYARISGGWS